ncbi:MAG: SDR family NAD(P)-dependent oxidoreductase, partial [Sphingomonas sp.]
MLLQGKTVLVTGASAGIGRAVAIGCARHGADVALNFNSDVAGANGAVAEIEALGRKGIAIQGDVAIEV